VAIVQISRIQVRRGKKQGASGVPQLASGELGWAVDTQELFIGNGAVSEGAPYVGNTKVLTEADSLLDYARSYSYRNDDDFINTGGVVRTIQDRLDDIVSVRAFGAKGDSSTDDTETLQRAIDQLYLNSVNKFEPEARVVLHFDPGLYKISSPLRIPAYVTLRGSGPDKTIIEQSDDFPIFITTSSESTPPLYSNNGFTQFNQPKEIEIEGMTLRTLSNFEGLSLSSVKNGVIRNVKIEGPFQQGDTILSSSVGVLLNATATQITCENISFENVQIEGFGTAIKSDYDIINNRFNVGVSKCGYGVVFGQNTNTGISGQITGPKSNRFVNSFFKEIDREGVNIINGLNNIVENCSFTNVGNDGGGSITANYSIINFNNPTNLVDKCFFDRSDDLSTNSVYSSAGYISEYSGKMFGDISASNTLELIGTSLPLRAFRLPATNKCSYTVEYWYVSTANNIKRTGTIDITVDPQYGDVDWSESYDYQGDPNLTKSLTFDVEVVDNDGDSVVDSINVNYTNTLASQDTGQLIYKYKVRY
jgi:predicted nucleic-acid-binding Zn-ribbon protein